MHITEIALKMKGMMLMTIYFSLAQVCDKREKKCAEYCHLYTYIYSIYIYIYICIYFIYIKSCSHEETFIFFCSMHVRLRYSTLMDISFQN